MDHGEHTIICMSTFASMSVGDATNSQKNNIMCVGMYL